jgi:hypothetical protein
MEYGNTNHAYLDESIEHAVGHSGVRRVTQRISGLIHELSKLCHLYNIRHN